MIRILNNPTIKIIITKLTLYISSNYLTLTAASVCPSMIIRSVASSLNTTGNVCIAVAMGSRTSSAPYQIKKEQKCSIQLQSQFIPPTQKLYKHRECSGNKKGIQIVSHAISVFITASISRDISAIQYYNSKPL